MKSVHTKLLLLLLAVVAHFLHTSLVAEKRHPLHVSTTEISYNAKERSLEVTTRIFTDDLEASLTKVSKSKVDLSRPMMKKEMDLLLSRYIAAHLQFSVDGKNLAANYIGYEIDKEATLVYTEILKVPSLNSIVAINTILYDLFHDQMSILHVEKGGRRKSASALYPDARLSVVYD